LVAGNVNEGVRAYSRSSGRDARNVWSAQSAANGAETALELPADVRSFRNGAGAEGFQPNRLSNERPEFIRTQPSVHSGTSVALKTQHLEPRPQLSAQFVGITGFS
jgi:hypothetical protein